MENSSYITLSLTDNFWTYAYIVTILLAGAMLTMWLGDQITEKGLGNGISVIIFAGCVRSLPTQITNAWSKWITQQREPRLRQDDQRQLPIRSLHPRHGLHHRLRGLHGVKQTQDPSAARWQRRFDGLDGPRILLTD
jgi:hypothetical protein